jgi:hypothetical protein
LDAVPPWMLLHTQALPCWRHGDTWSFGITTTGASTQDRWTVVGGVGFGVCVDSYLSSL